MERKKQGKAERKTERKWAGRRGREKRDGGETRKDNQESEKDGIEGKDTKRMKRKSISHAHFFMPSLFLISCCLSDSFCASILWRISWSFLEITGQVFWCASNSKRSSRERKRTDGLGDIMEDDRITNEAFGRDLIMSVRGCQRKSE